MADTLCIGVDVGGTNTDVVILKGNEIAAKGKLATTEDITSGVASCIETVINDFATKAGQTVEKIKSFINRVNIGTTHFINAVIQRKHLDKVSVIRLCGPASKALPPFSDFPSDLKEAIYGGCYLVNGGYNFDGKEITSLNQDEIVSAVNEIKKIGIKNIVISGIFAASNPNQEQKVKEIISRHYDDASISLSHEIGHNGILERENAAILNESLKSLSKVIVNGFETHLKTIGITCPFYLTQNDGTLIRADDVIRFPVHTFSSGATNSLRGASFLSGLKDAIVIDIGGTSSDVGVLRKGFPKEASTRVKVGGVNTNFRMPDVISIGLGGGSIVTKGAKVEVSKQSVERRLEKDALVFGGSILTTTDIAVAAGLASIGDPGRVSHLDKSICEDVLHKIKSKLESLIDQVKLSGESCPVVIVGGGSILVQDGTTFEGVSKLIKPRHFEVANAVGAALSQISGTFDRFVDISQMTPEEAIAMAKKSAVEIALKNGAIGDTIEIIEIVDTNISYVTIPTRRIKVKAVGDLEVRGHVAESIQASEQSVSASVHEGLVRAHAQETSKIDAGETSVDKEAHVTSTPTASDFRDLNKPHIDKETGEWILNERDVECLCVGAGIMGCGGGGSTYIGRLRLMSLLKEGKKLRIIDPLSLKGKTGLILVVAFMGAPAILIEKLVGGNEIPTAAKAVMKMYALGLGKDNGELSDKTREKLQIKREENVEVIGNMAAVLQSEGSTDSKEHSILALMSPEMGGMNSVEAIIAAAESGLPVVDCDSMGRAFPKLEQMIPLINGCSPTPAAICDEKGEVVAAVTVDSAHDLENFFRKHTIRMGCASGVAVAFTVDEIVNNCPLYTLSRAWRVGNAVLSARKDHKDPVEALVENENAGILIVGKVVEVHRETKQGFDFGYSIIEGLAKYSGKKLKIEFQNENLVAVDMVSNETIATVPDLISLVDSDTGEPISTEENRYGLRVSVIVLPAMPIMCTDKTLTVFGPQAFGYKDLNYAPFVNFKDFEPITVV